jgi:hypothetical protein
MYFFLDGTATDEASQIMLIRSIVQIFAKQFD